MGRCREVAAFLLPSAGHYPSFAFRKARFAAATHRRRRLVPRLNERSEASIEFKRRNISAVLEGLGVPALRADNIQRDLGAE